MGELSGDGGLLLTSLNVDSVSIGDRAKEDGGPMSTGLGWTLDGLMDVSICNHSDHHLQFGMILYLKSGKKLPVASLLCRLKIGRGSRRSGGS